MTLVKLIRQNTKWTMQEKTAFQKIKLFLGLGLVLISLILIFQNISSVPLTVLWMKFEVSLFLIILTSLIVGFILGYLIFTRKQKAIKNKVQ
ncbi:hypothetical protein DNU06_02715 [Putridiphycobacter roseus]|uniref:Lipopolysaccharide assembly protein A domain-containing protein n=1 Tax=Putridiphycobacter roseus TaxID=2219161 RepID=A0A2W1NVE3_9FLAO|nr:hypothetical protein DNU06_02715 [Putridiphycobacter roseus]